VILVFFSYLESSIYCDCYTPPTSILFCSFRRICRLITAGGASSSGMVYGEGTERLYAGAHPDSDAHVDNILRVWYPGALPLSSDVAVTTSGTLTVFAHNTTPFARRDVVCVLLGEGLISFGSILRQTTGDGKEGYVPGRRRGRWTRPAQ
jgi:hypothetical protein